MKRKIVYGLCKSCGKRGVTVEKVPFKIKAKIGQFYLIEICHYCKKVRDVR